MPALGTSALAISPANSALLYAGASGFPTTNTSDAFLTRLDATTGSILTSTVLSGSDTNQGWAVAVDGAGNSYVVGVTTATNFPTAATSGPLSATNSGGNDVFVTVLNADASALLYSAYLGGTADDFGYGIAVDPAGNAYVVGQTSSSDFPVVSGLQTNLAGVSDAFVAKIQAGTTPSLVATLLAGRDLQLKWPAFPPAYALETTSSLSSGAVWTTVANQTPVLSNGCYTISLPTTGTGAFFRLHRH